LTGVTGSTSGVISYGYLTAETVFSLSCLPKIPELLFNEHLGAKILADVFKKNYSQRTVFPTFESVTSWSNAHKFEGVQHQQICKSSDVKNFSQKDTTSFFGKFFSHVTNAKSYFWSKITACHKQKKHMVQI